MSAQMPTLPPRPARSQERQSEALQNAPQIPPRPTRVADRSESPHRAEYTRSPLNEPPTSIQNGGKIYGHKNLSAQDLPRRPPSVSLPLIGQEGNEYASFDDSQEATRGSSEQTRNVSPDLPMHAPKASVPQSTATSRIATVTRTDSSQAAAVGIGKAETDGPSLKAKSSFTSSHPLKARSSFNRSNVSLNSQERPSSAQGHDDEEHGIPSFGMQVPMLKYAGDVQAPSPAPYAQTQSSGIGFYNDQTPRNHHRKRSSRQEFGPPGSYGMHGHGVEPKDQFEKAWYQKHPEEYSKEAKKTYDPGHPKHEWALSSDDLNKLVHQTRDQGMGTTTGMIGTPTEQIGYMASEEYASRINSPNPRPASMSNLNKRPSNGAHSQPRIESPLRKTSFAQNETGHLKATKSHDNAIDSDFDDDDVIHVDPPAHRASKYGGGGYDPPKEDFGPHGGNTEEEGGWVVENGYGVPILASDEVAKNTNPDAEYMQPAVSPEQERRGSDYYAGYDSEHPPSYQTGRRSTSRSGSHGEPLSRFISREANPASGMGTPLEEIEEYEPLFPEDEKEPAKPLTAADKLKRPDLARHHFPSQDIWEDTPESLQYQTTVEHPQEPEELSTSATFEPPAKEEARKELDPSDRADFLTESTRKMAKTHFKPGVAEDMGRPDMARRFPSRDVWEDTPDSLNLETTVSGPQMEESQEWTSPADTQPPQEAFAKPSIPVRPARSGLSQQVHPELPARPQQKAGQAGDAPQIPARPKPQVPARPARGLDGQEGTPLVKVTSGESSGSGSIVTSPPVAKAKPAVPSRPAGSSKFAALKAGFMNDLNSRLQLGPQAPPKAPEPAAEDAPTEERAPLADARKGRARGPARRKPAAEAAAADTSAPAKQTFSLTTPFTVFQINDHGEVSVPTSELDPTAAAGANELEKIASAGIDGAGPAGLSAAAAAAPLDEKTALSGLTPQAIGFSGDIPEPRISPASLERQQALEPALEAALADSRKDAATAPAKGATDIASQVPAFSSEVPIQEAEAEQGSGMTDSSAQTGEQKIEVVSPKGEQEKMVVTLGGNAPEEGDVVQKGGEEIVEQHA